jgi:hypothetical protein
MIISTNSSASEHEFCLLLDRLTEVLNDRARKDPTLFRDTEGRKLEPLVCRTMELSAKGTVFEGTIRLYSGQRFPDIVVNKRFGVEVKSTTQDHWVTTGNSVNEATRIEGVERIFVLFGKLKGSMEFRWRPYEKCLSDIAVTHSPRYRIDMNLPDGQTILDKMGISYDELRESPDPIKVVTAYYRRILKPGQDVWWLGERDDATARMVVKHFCELPAAEKALIRAQAFVLFPEIVGPASRDKYRGVVAWLVARHGVVCSTMRDLFTAGGQVTLKTSVGEFENIPRVFGSLQKAKKLVLDFLGEADQEDLEHYWRTELPPQSDRFSVWLSLLEKAAAPNLRNTGLKVADIFR